MPASLAAPPTPDPRLPASGTVLQKKDRHGAVRCECTVEEGGIRYSGKVYHGFVFWGIGKPPRRPGDPMVVLERAWERYHGNVQALVKEGVTDDNRSKVVAAISKHAQVIESLREKLP